MAQGTSPERRSKSLILSYPFLNLQRRQVIITVVHHAVIVAGNVHIRSATPEDELEAFKAEISALEAQAEGEHSWGVLCGMLPISNLGHAQLMLIYRLVFNGLMC